MGKLKILAAAAGFLLFLKLPVYAQAPEDISPRAVAADQEQGQAPGQDQLMGDANWWLENDGLTFGYLPYGYGYGFGLGGCGASPQAGSHGTAWWNAGGTNAWFPTGQQLPYPYGSGWCGNNYGYAPYGLNANQLVVVTNGHHHGPKHKPGGGTNKQIARLTNTPHTSEADEGGPDDDWIRVEDHVESPHSGEAGSGADSRNQAIRQVAGGGAGRPQRRNPQGARLPQIRSPEHRPHAQPRATAHAHIAPHLAAAHAAAHLAVHPGNGHS
jgi:hypothetical protein